MLTLFALLLFPVLIALGGFVVSNLPSADKSYQVTLKEFAILEVVSIVLICGAYALALHDRTSDREFLNGSIVAKNALNSSCCHSYSCNCRSCNCDSKGSNCSTCCDTCYEHSYDEEYTLDSSTGDQVYAARCLRPGSGPPARWSAAVIGEPAAVMHSFTNYIRGNPESILRLRGLAQKYSIPNYPKPFDYYRSRRVLPTNVSIPDINETVAHLERLNADLGAAKQVNAIVVVTTSPDPEYAEGLREAWLGGKKNDVVLVIGTPAFPEIAWSSVISWTKQEQFKIDLRDRIVGMKTWNGPQIVDALSTEIQHGYTRRRMADFEYLTATIQPTTRALWFIGIFGALLQIVGTYWFWKNDPFGSSFGSYQLRYNRG